MKGKVQLRYALLGALWGLSSIAMGFVLGLIVWAGICHEG